MSILIKGMETPKSCDECDFLEQWRGEVAYCGILNSQIPCECPLVPVSPHGRLLKVLKTERECVSRDCNRDCGKCDLSLERDEVLSAYDTLIALFADTAEKGEE